mgnify:CR=1 FL=1
MYASVLLELIQCYFPLRPDNQYSPFVDTDTKFQGRFVYVLCHVFVILHPKGTEANSVYLPFC